MYILETFNQLEIKGNLNNHQSYRRFLDIYLTSFSNLGYVNTEEVCLIRNMGCETGLDSKSIIEGVVNPLRRKLIVLKKKIPIESIQNEIVILLRFLGKNEKMMKNERKLVKPEVKVNSKIESRLINQEEVDRLTKLEEETFLEEVLTAYEKGDVTAYEIGWMIDKKQLYRIHSCP